jgi:hypothetical protein
MTLLRVMRSWQQERHEIFISSRHRERDHLLAGHQQAKDVGASQDHFDFCPFDEAPLCPPLPAAGSHVDVCVPRPETCAWRSDRRGFSRRSLSIQCRRRRSVSAVVGASVAFGGIAGAVTQPAMANRASSRIVFTAPSSWVGGPGAGIRCARARPRHVTRHRAGRASRCGAPTPPVAGVGSSP